MTLKAAVFVLWWMSVQSKYQIVNLRKNYKTYCGFAGYE